MPGVCFQARTEREFAMRARDAGDRNSRYPPRLSLPAASVLGLLLTTMDSVIEADHVRSVFTPRLNAGRYQNSEGELPLAKSRRIPSPLTLLEDREHEDSPPHWACPGPPGSLELLATQHQGLVLTTPLPPHPLSLSAEPATNPLQCGRMKGIRAPCQLPSCLRHGPSKKPARLERSGPPCTWPTG